MPGELRYDVGDRALSLVQGDITDQTTDAIVNAANRELRGGDGVDGAIHRAGGPAILAECRLIGGCATGSAVATGAGNLPCRWVIHAVGPVWRGGTGGEAAALASAYRSSIARADELGARTLAFPSISTGAYGYPVEQAAPIAVAAVRTGMAAVGLELVRFVLFNSDVFAAYRAAATALLGHPSRSPR